ncbi:hypothetical protein CFI10_07080 [Marinobacterium iners]|uniref:hypothetical protein n=1 Tax=Marinobacterium iners TaxID=48076 RepID=UPI001A8F07C5|nr:hypothetical protein [Marinobacterium iners]QSR34760.1 hypothetical protein CFI10_07080 [Marinobacterium iners]
MPLPNNVAAIFPYPANWTSPLIEGRDYKTDVMRSRDGTEQRRALRSKPRKNVSFEVLLEGRDAANFDYLMTALQPHVLLLPMWQRSHRLAVAVSAGGNTLQLTQPVSYERRSGDYLVLHRNGEEPEAQQIETVAADRLSVTLVDTLESNWPAFTSVYPAELAQLRSRFTGRRLTSGLLRAGLDFSCLVDSRAPGTSSLTADLVISDLEVLIRPVNWGSTPEIGYNWAPVMVDAELGPSAYETDGDVAIRTRKGEVLTESRDEVDWWLAFFDRCRGRQRPFLMPTWFDLHLQTPVTPGAIFEVPGTELGMYLSSDPVHTHLMVRKRDRSLAFFEITALTANLNDGVTVITTTESWGEAYAPWECVQASLVTVCRLASDRLEVEWITDEVAKCAIAVQIVEDVA